MSEAHALRRRERHAAGVTTLDRPERSRAKRDSTLGSRINETSPNTLNLVRLILASSVIVGHAWPLTGSTVTPSLGFVGGIAVNGFFAASGYLIAGSRMHTTLVAFLWRRILRIFPALIICALFIGFVIAPIAAAYEGNRFNAEDALGFVGSTVFLLNRQWTIDGTLTQAPYPDAWDGSTWTLQFEFLAYLVIAAVLGTVLIRKHVRLMLSLLAAVAIPAFFLATHFLDVTTNFYLSGLRLGAYFVVGAAMYAWRDVIQVRAPLLVGAAVVFVVLAVFELDWYFGQIPLAYIVLGLGSFSWKNFTADNDMSYGVYIYAFPVAQMLVLFGTAPWGLIPNILLTLSVTLLFAWCSWTFIERPALRLKRLVPSDWHFGA